ncbi:hypothetical protein JAAARDRAFT_194178 [Jaapia argillacea MUCL 33604]|uniref:Uncharacterized protein n=1 Tax=Jaapia argillacea MUCL 33604 TaxID=933084 RepID=A0A067PQG0_9AGAM|nr:hypothetical protein JAAARDRAFT_194178 [Jaapia argillacea MUCL 33604]
MSTAVTASTELKAQGNSLFAKKDFIGAFNKYSAAIDQDPTNAILYANRTACSLNLQKYFDCADDCRKAIEIDPGYSKAWGRLATAQDAIGNPSLEAWSKALETLPGENLSPGELRQKEQYEEGLRLAKEKFENVSTRLVPVALRPDQLPWTRAVALMPELIANQQDSSAWVILKAYQEFSEGVKTMKLVKRVEQVGQRTVIVGIPNALSNLSNGILRDRRVFHIDGPKWITNFTDQMLLEALEYNAWDRGDAASVIEQAQARQREKGWKATRRALSCTIRGWIMRGFFENGLKNNEQALKFYGWALEVLDWGRKAWKDVPSEDRGAIFESSVARGVRVLHMNTYMQAWSPDLGEDQPYSLEELLEEADDIIRDVDNNPLDPRQTYDPGFVLSFTSYPRGTALAVKGYCHAEMAALVDDDGDEDDESSPRHEHYVKSAEYYVQAGSSLPEDDEDHAWFLNCALQKFWLCGAPLRVTLPIMKRIRLAIPKMKRIWENSPPFAKREPSYQQTMRVEKDALEGIEEGKYTLTDVMNLSH